MRCKVEDDAVVSQAYALHSFRAESYYSFGQTAVLESEWGKIEEGEEELGVDGAHGDTWRVEYYALRSTRLHADLRSNGAM